VAALEASRRPRRERAAIIMTNQPKWLLSAYAVFFAGGVVVPLELQNFPPTSSCNYCALESAGAVRGIRTGAPSRRLLRSRTSAGTVLSRKRRRTLTSEAAAVGGLSRRAPARIPDALAKRHRVHRLFFGNGGRPKGCVLTHENYLNSAPPLRRFSLSGLRALPEHHFQQITDRFHGWIYHAVHRAAL